LLFLTLMLALFNCSILLSCIILFYCFCVCATHFFFCSSGCYSRALHYIIQVLCIHPFHYSRVLLYFSSPPYSWFCVLCLPGITPLPFATCGVV
jgi:hypothetical protein